MAIRLEDLPTNEVYLVPVIGPNGEPMEVELSSLSARIADDVPMPGPAWPIGSLFIAIVPTNPAILLGFGEWASFGTGRVPVGYDANDSDFNAAEKIGGTKSVVLTEAQMPVHSHVQDSHNHTQNAHAHTITSQTATTGSATSYEHGALDTSSAETEATETTNPATATNQGTVATNQNAGGGQAHNNLPPFITVFMWKRTA